MNGTLSDKDRTTLLNALNGAGIFVTCGRKTPNIMVAHWGALGKFWGREVFFLPIRSNKYSYEIVTSAKSFALNVPCRDMRAEISRCDTISGYKYNKFEELDLHAKRARSIEAYVLGECGLIVECRLIARIPPENILPEVADLFGRGKAHTLFVGELADCYRLNK